MKLKLLVALLLAALPMSALAEAVGTPPAEASAAPVEVVAFDEADAGYDGVWVPFEDGFRLYLPGTWRSFELTDAQRAAGLFYRAGNGAGASDGGVAMGVAVGYMAAGDVDDLDALSAYFEDSGFSDVRRLSLNGLPAVGFERPEAGYRGAAFFHPTLGEYVMLVYATPIGEAADAILASLGPRDAGQDGE